MQWRKGQFILTFKASSFDGAFFLTMPLIVIQSIKSTDHYLFYQKLYTFALPQACEVR